MIQRVTKKIGDTDLILETGKIATATSAIFISFVSFILYLFLFCLNSRIA